jgi:NADH:ubiquinone oxidoreductase subunit E
VDVEVCEQLERQRDELLELLTVIRTVASYPHHPNALHAIASMAKNSIAAVKGDHT